MDRSNLEIKGECDISHNFALNGGGIFKDSFTIQYRILKLSGNNASYGGGMHLKLKSKLYLVISSVPYYSNRSMLMFAKNKQYMEEHYM